MEGFLGLDVGTSNVKATIFDEHGTPLVESRRHCELNVEGGAVEQSTDDLWRAASEAMRECVRGSNSENCVISGVGVSGQTNGLIPIDGKGRPLHPCITWLDMRGVEQANRVKEVLGEREINKKTGIVANPFYLLFKIMWLKETRPKIFEESAVFLQPKDFVVLKLTGECISDIPLASTAGFIDLNKRDYALDLLNEVGIPIDKIPRLVNSSDVVGEIEAGMLKNLRLRHRVPVVAGSGDSIANMIGSGVVDEGLAYNKMATASDVATCINKPAVDWDCRLATYVSPIDGKWMMIGGSSGGGICLQWFGDNFAERQVRKSRKSRLSPTALLEDEAEKAEAGSRGLIFLPYLKGERSPIWDPSSKGLFFGITLEHQRRHFIRAILEGVSFSVRQRIEVMERALGVDLHEMRVVGGWMRSRLYKRILVRLQVDRPTFLWQFRAGRASGSGKNVVGRLFASMIAMGRHVSLCEASV